LLNSVPFWLGYTLYALVSVAGLFCFSRVFRGEGGLILLTYQALYVMFYGQANGWLAAGLGLLWWGLSRRSWAWAGFGLLLAGIKFQSGLPIAGILLLAAPVSWRERFKVCLVPAATLIVTLLVWPGWIPSLLDRLRNSPANDFASISLWRYFGAAALFLILPVLMPGIGKSRRILLGLALVPLVSPYYQQADLLLLMPFFPAWAIMAGNLGFLYIWFIWDGLRVLSLLPGLVYLTQVSAALRAKILPGSPSGAASR
jgi:hypothetical protein